MSRVTKLLMVFQLWLRLLLFDLYGAPKRLDGFVELSFGFVETRFDFQH